ncbi:hypothetical protein AKJ16_DCAP02720 [Drosera capensis]
MDTSYDLNSQEAFRGRGDFRIITFNCNAHVNRSMMDRLVVEFYDRSINVGCLQRDKRQD